MVTSTRGRSGSRTRSTSSRFSSFSGRAGQSRFGRTGTSTTGRTTPKTKSKRSGATGSPAAYRSCNTTFAQKIQSFKTLFQQTTGMAKFHRPSPTTLNSFANWINKGAIVQTVTTAQLARWAKTTRKSFPGRSATPTACKSVLCAKFGKSTIKAVARSKSGSFMVATAPTVSGKKFSFPK